MARPARTLVTTLLVTALSVPPGCSTIPTQQQPAANGTAAHIAPNEDGWIRLHAVPTWSNGESPEWYLRFQAEKPDGYRLFAYERGHGFVPVTFRQAPPPSPSSSSGSGLFSLGGGGGDPAGIGMLIVIGLLVHGVSKLLEDRPRPRYPSQDCCFVWIENAATGEMLDGTSPWKTDSGG